MKAGLLKGTFFNKMNYVGTLAVRSMVSKIVARSVANALKGAVLPTAVAAYRNRRRIIKGIGYASNIVSLKRPATGSPMETPARTPRARQRSASRGRPRTRSGTATARSVSMRSRSGTRRSRSTSMVPQKDTHKGRQGVTGHKKAKTKTKKAGTMPKGVKGVSSRIENRGNIAGGDCVYIGHGVPLQKIWGALWLTVIKDLFAGKGTDMFDPTKIIPGVNAYFITVSFYQDFSADAIDSFQAVSVVGVTTYFDMVDKIILAYVAKFSPAAFAYQPYVDRISLDQFTNAPTNTLSINHAIIYAANYTVNIVCKSSLKFLNATPATAFNVADVVNDSTEDIRAHPLVGYKYECKKESVIIPNVRQDSVTGWPGFSLPIGTGYFSWNDSALGTGGPSTVTNHFKKPPVNGVFANVGKRIPVSMEPGEILTDIVLWEKKMTLKTWIQKYHQQGRSTAAIEIMIPMGAMNLIALEHKLFFTGDASVLIEFQQDLSILTYSKHTLKKNSVMFTQVNAA